MSARHKRRPARSLNRRTGTRRENRRLLVVTEGKTEKEYLEGLMQSLRPDGMQVTAIDVVDGRGEPSKVLKTAKARYQSRADDYDEVWLLLDVDQHAKLPPFSGKHGRRTSQPPCPTPVSRSGSSGTSRTGHGRAPAARSSRPPDVTAWASPSLRSFLTTSTLMRDVGPHAPRSVRMRSGGTPPPPCRPCWR